MSVREGVLLDAEAAPLTREATARVRTLFTEKQAQIREQITQLQVIENDQREDVPPLEQAEGYARLTLWTRITTRT